MAYRSTETTSHIYMMDRDWVVVIEYIKTSNGYKGSYWDPPHGPDFDIERIWISEDGYKYEGPRWELTGKMFDLIQSMDDIQQAVIDDISESSYYDGYDD